ncbi:ABC transporter substrate-binding protein [Paenibacillus eucommiae]|uniref:Multiple sugar transport system substrate-binding protein n=1 Tax=Paenibacillus eucommiae TaxID=1355755 RepID=A0ABS4IZB0_9BACL|nr:ABC transporter substrate-binding protein [Paenibacillus eucommiae]MBP1992929.1 multiple sugar transport system substrate-binding protein [Paenibacillus eucommiae]
MRNQSLNMKKAMLLVMCLVFICIAAGCSSSSSAEKETGSKPTADNKDKVKLEFYYGLGGKLGDTMSKIIQDFNSSSTKYEVVPVIQGNYSETLQKLQASLAANKPPALAINGYPEFTKLAKNEVLLPLDAYINQPEYNKDDILLLDQGNYNNAVLGVPSFVSTQMMYYRKDIFDKYNIDYNALESFEQLADAAKTIKEKEGINGWSIMWYAEHMIDYARSAGGDIASEDGKTITIDSEEWIYAWDSIRKWIHEDKTMNTVYGGNGWEWWYKTIDGVMNGKSAGYTGSSGDGGDLDFTKVATGMQKGLHGSKPRPVAVSVMFNLFKDSPKEQQEGAWEFVKYFSEAEQTAYWAVETGYIPIRDSAVNTEIYQNKLKENPYLSVPLEQAKTNGIAPYVDPTGGKIYAEIELAKDEVLIGNKPAAEVLKEAKKKAQNELDKVLNQK